MSSNDGEIDPNEEGASVKERSNVSSLAGGGGSSAQLGQLLGNQSPGQRTRQPANTSSGSQMSPVKTGGSSLKTQPGSPSKKGMYQGAAYGRQPGAPLRALITPEEWLNIPPCQVNAWKDAIEHHDRLLEMVARLAGSQRDVDKQFDAQRQQVEGKMKREMQESGRDTGRLVAQLESRQKSALKEVANTVAELTRQLEAANQELHVHSKQLGDVERDMETEGSGDKKLAACRQELMQAIQEAEVRAASWTEQKLAQMVQKHLTVPELIGNPGDPFSSLPDYLLRTKAATEHDFRRISRKFEDMSQRATQQEQTALQLRAYTEEQIILILEDRFPKLNENLLTVIEEKHEAGQKALDTLRISVEAELEKHGERSRQLRELLASQQTLISTHDHAIRRSVTQLDARAQSLTDDIAALQKSLFQTKDRGTKVADKLSQLQKELRRVEELKTRTRQQLIEKSPLQSQTIEQETSEKDGSGRQTLKGRNNASPLQTQLASTPTSAKQTLNQIQQSPKMKIIEVQQKQGDKIQDDQDPILTLLGQSQSLFRNQNMVPAIDTPPQQIAEENEEEILKTLIGSEDNESRASSYRSTRSRAASEERKVREAAAAAKNAERDAKVEALGHQLEDQKIQIETLSEDVSKLQKRLKEVNRLNSSKLKEMQKALIDQTKEAGSGKDSKALESRLDDTDKQLRKLLEEVAERIEEKATLPFRSSYVPGQEDQLVQGSRSLTYPDGPYDSRFEAPELARGSNSISIPFPSGSRSVMAVAAPGQGYLLHQERSGSVVELRQSPVHQQPARGHSRLKNYRMDYVIQHEELKMPEIVERRDKARLQRLSNVKNIYVKNSEPLQIKFERFGRNFD